MTFTEYIKTQGYELQPRKGKEDEFSTMKVQTSYYKKGDKVIAWGLYEYHKPPTLTYPNIYTLEKKGDVYWIHDNHDTKERIMKSISNEELLTRIENNQLRFKL
jgi:hypothetical protein